MGDSEDPTSPRAEEGRDPTSAPLTAQLSTDEEIAGVAELPEDILEGKSLGILGPDNPLRMAVFMAITHW